MPADYVFNYPSNIGFGIPASASFGAISQAEIQVPWSTTTYLTIVNNINNDVGVMVYGEQVAVLPPMSPSLHEIFNAQTSGKTISLGSIMTYSVNSGNLVTIGARKPNSNSDYGNSNYLYFAFSGEKCVDYAIPAPISSGFWTNIHNCIEIVTSGSGLQIVELPVVYTSRVKTHPSLGRYYQAFYYFDIQSNSFRVSLKNSLGNNVYYELSIPDAAMSYDWMAGGGYGYPPYVIKCEGSTTITDAKFGRYCISYIFYENTNYSKTPYTFELELL